ncbi:MAG: hypothetical protein ACRD3Q_05435, partial [Terriglobales bacterium]
VASTDMERAGIMMARIRGQMERMPELKTGGEFEVSAVPVPLASLLGPVPDAISLDKQVAAVAERVTEMVRTALVPSSTITTARDGASPASETRQSASLLRP